MEALLGCEFADNSHPAQVANALVLLSYSIIWTGQHEHFQNHVFLKTSTAWDNFFRV